MSFLGRNNLFNRLRKAAIHFLGGMDRFSVEPPITSPPDYIVDHDYMGNAYPKSEQVARCGNTVPPPFAAALVRANLPEWCGKEINTMAEFEQAVAV